MAGIGDIAKAGGVKYDDAAKTIEGIRILLLAGEKITLQDFGTFETDVQDTRNARNPSSGDAIITVPKMVPKFGFNYAFRKKFEAIVVDESKLTKKRAAKAKWLEKQAAKTVAVVSPPTTAAKGAIANPALIAPTAKIKR